MLQAQKSEAASWGPWMAADPPASAASELTGCVKANESDVVLFLPGTSSEKTRDPFQDKET